MVWAARPQIGCGVTGTGTTGTMGTAGTRPHVGQCPQFGQTCGPYDQRGQ